MTNTATAVRTPRPNCRTYAAAKVPMSLAFEPNDVRRWTGGGGTFGRNGRAGRFVAGAWIVVVMGAPVSATGTAGGPLTGPVGTYAPQVDTPAGISATLSRVLEAAESSSPVLAVEGVTAE